MNTKRRNRLLWNFAIVLVTAPLLAVEPETKPAAQPVSGRIRLTISKKTTRILGPVNKDGTVNYVAYLEAKYSKGVTKANNFAIPLIRILGADRTPESAGRKILSLLDIKYSAEGEDSFITLWDYLKKTLSEEDYDAWMERSDLHESLAKPWKTEQHPVIAKWLKTNEKPLNAILVAVRRTRYFVPGVSPGPDVNIPARQCLMVIRVSP